MNKKLWSSKPLERLKAARQMTSTELKQLHKNLGKGCPVEPWPYGNATTVNPFLVTLGVSPGNSPAAGDTTFLRAGGHQLPTAGAPHPGTRYRDPRRYWDKVRILARTTVMGADANEDDVLSLFGNINLDTGQSGQAENVVVKAEFAAWVLHSIRYHLKPRYVVMLGLPTYLRSNRDIAEIFEKTFPGFKVERPHREVPFHAYEKKRFVFREWDIANECSEGLTLVMWPQHPSQSPFTNLEFWHAACQEFAERHKLPTTDN